MTLALTMTMMTTMRSVMMMFVCRSSSLSSLGSLSVQVWLIIKLYFSTLSICKSHPLFFFSNCQWLISPMVDLTKFSLVDLSSSKYYQIIIQIKLISSSCICISQWLISPPAAARPHCPVRSLPRHLCLQPPESDLKISKLQPPKSWRFQPRKSWSFQRENRLSATFYGFSGSGASAFSSVAIPRSKSLQP